jgi:hypothetical protein
VAKKAKGINPELEKAISKLLEQTMADDSVSIADKSKVIDRALKLEALKAKLDQDEWGSGFFGGDDEDDDK